MHNPLALNRRGCLALVGASLCLGSGTARAQAYPARPLTLIVPFTAGGPLDIVARGMTDVMATNLKQTFVIDNRAGATGNIGAQAVARAQPDGYTLLMTLDSSLTANPTLYGSRMGFDVEQDLVPISMVVGFNQLLAVHPSTGIKDLKQFVEAARKGLNYASAGIASPGHLTMEALHSQIGGRLNHIPYKGNVPAVNDLLGGQVDAAFVATPSLLQHVASGKLTALAVSGSKRSPLAPDVPTIAEQGYPGATTDFGFAFMAPAGTPPAIVERLHAEARKALSVPEVAARFAKLDMQVVASTPQETAKMLKAGRQRWAKVIEERGIRPTQ